jgi:hypothetical protein
MQASLAQKQTPYDKNTYLNRRIEFRFSGKTSPLTQGKLGLNCKESRYYGANRHGVRALPAYLPGSAGKHSCNDRFAAHHNTTSVAIVGRDTTFLGEQGPDRHNFTCNGNAA